MRRSNGRVDLENAASTLANGRGAASSAPTPTPARRRPAARVALLSGLGREWRGMTVRASATGGGRELRYTRLSTYVMSADGVLASGQFLPVVKASLKNSAHAETGQIDPLLPAGEPTRRRSSTIRGRSLLDDLGKVACGGSLPSRSRRDVLVPEVVRRQTDLTGGTAEPATGDRGVVVAGHPISKSSIERVYTPS